MQKQLADICTYKDSL